MPKLKAKLTPKQQAFVDEYLCDLNATQAAIRAGYSEKTAFTIGIENLKKPLIREAIRKAQEERAQRTEITQDRVLREIATLAFSDLSDFVKWGKNGVIIKDLSELTKLQTRCVAEVSETKEGNIRLKLYDKTRALDMLCRHLGMYAAEKHDFYIEEKLLNLILSALPNQYAIAVKAALQKQLVPKGHL